MRLAGSDSSSSGLATGPRNPGDLLGHHFCDIRAAKCPCRRGGGQGPVNFQCSLDAKIFACNSTFEILQRFLNRACAWWKNGRGFDLAGKLTRVTRQALPADAATIADPVSCTAGWRSRSGLCP